MKFLQKIAIGSALIIGLVVAPITADASSFAEVIANGGLNVRTGGGMDYNIITAIPQGSIVDIVTPGDEWSMVRDVITGTEGYVASRYIKIREDIKDQTGNQVISYAKQFVGVPYVYGGMSPNGFDCSGFTKYVYAGLNVSINRTAQAQYSNGISVNREDLQPGDLVFFGSSTSNISHVGIYVGDNTFIHAKSPGKPLGYSQLSENYYAKRYVGAKRLIY
ncbi:MAG: C40 family peptidase [Clostridiales bacterium]|jgi:cell wall-associated NlpC family hydrolase|nr:C40 family peptidase [Clostridiales bacterium]